MIIGHERQLEYLTRVVRSGNVPHAFVFSGPDHIGKRLIAQVFFYLCSSAGASPKDFFNGDRLANALSAESHPDLFVARVAEGRKEISINQIRSLKKFVSLSPFELEKKFVLVDNAHAISYEGANSILKTLEEPSGETVIVLVTSRRSALPATILSRSITIPFYSLSEPALCGGLEREKITVGPKELAWIAGRPGLAIRFAQNPDGETVSTLRENFITFSKMIGKKSVQEKIRLAEQVASEEQLTTILSSWLLACRSDILKNQSRSGLDLARGIFELRELLARTNVNSRLQLENLLLRV